MKIDKYTHWWAESEAINVAKLHNLGLSHRHLIGQNLTLDGGFSDNRKISKSSKLDNWLDIGNVLTSTRIISENLSLNAAENQKLFLEKYFKNRKEISEDEVRFIHSNFISHSVENQYYTKLTKITEKEFEKRFGKKIS